MRLSFAPWCAGWSVMGAFRTRLATLAGDRSGATVLEAALVAPMLLVTMAGMIDGGRVILQQMQLQAAAQAGADYARGQGGDLTGVAGAVRASTGLAVTLTPPPRLQEGCATSGGIVAAVKKKDKCTGSGNSDPGTYVIVTVQMPFTTLAPWPGLTWKPTMSATAAVRID